MRKENIIVGIGASAGGLEAINELFEHLSEDTGMAFVVVQHLSPDFKSMMDELLAKHTNMPISVVQDKIAIEPNHVYLIDAGSNIIIEDDILKSVERGELSHPNLPINKFFHALGKNSKNLCIGIILSGTGTDGSRGIRTLKENNGLVFAQEPSTARFDGMPKMAIETGLVDQILTPKEMAETLLSIAKTSKNSTRVSFDLSDDTSEELVTGILKEILEQVGYNFLPYRRSTILRRIEKRMFLNSIKNLEDYSNFAKANLKELEILSKEFLIGVTRFFRDQEAYHFLQKHVIPELFRNKSANDITRIWVAGCSTGEEAYTLAILIEDYLDKNNIRRDYKIFASDLDAGAIRKAGIGVYPAQISEDIRAPLLSTYFEQQNNGYYKIIKKIRDQIVFTEHDLMNDPPFINMDLISCRNLLIYLNPDAQQRLYYSFVFALHYRGYLMLGPSESLGKMKSSFDEVNERWSIFRSNVEGKINPNFIQRKAKTRKIVNTKHAPLPGISYHDLVQHPDDSPNVRISMDTYVKMLMKRYVPTSIVVDEELNVYHAHGELGRLLTFPNNPAMFNLENMVSAEDIIIFKNGIRRTKETNQSNVFEDILLKQENNRVTVDIQFEKAHFPLQDKPYFIIEFREKPESARPYEKPHVVVSGEDNLHEELLQTMEKELRRGEEERKSLLERMESINEELQSSNEELTAANEELQSTNEELQSVNEELYTVNAELQAKVNELTVANNDLDNLLRATEIGTIFVDQNLRIRKFTPATAKQFQLLETDIGRPITSFSSHLDGVDFEKLLPEVIQRQEIVEQEVEDLEGNFYLMRLIPYTSSEGPSGIVITFVNILSVRKVGTEARILADQFEAIFESTENIVSVLSPEGTLLDLNHVPEGYEYEQIIGFNFFTDIIPTDIRKIAKAAFDKSIKTRQSVEYDVETFMPDGKVHFYRTHMIPIFKQEKIKRVLCSSQDLTDIVENREKTRLEAAIYQNVFQHAREHIMILDREGIILDINYTDAGYHKQDLLGKHLLEVTVPDMQERTKEGFLKILNGESVATYTITFSDAEGQQRWYQNILSPIQKEGKLERVVVISRDVTDTKLIELDLQKNNAILEARLNRHNEELNKRNQELAEINNFMDNFVHGAAHDLRSPLQILIGFIDLLPKIEDREAQLPIFAKLKNATNRMGRVLEGLVELIDFQQNQRPKPKLIQVKPFAEHAISALQEDLEKAGGQIEIDIPEELSLMYIEAFLQSVLHNLLHNAIKYHSYERRLKIALVARKEDGFVRLSVTDNGIGMNLARYGHFLFTPFRRLTLEREGTGIGLSIINNAVKRNGGRIEVESKLNIGTTFHVFLKPYTEEENEETANA